MENEPRTYVGQTGTQAFDGYAGLRTDGRYIGVLQDNGAVLVSAVGAPVGSGVQLSREQWDKWFKKYSVLDDF